MKTCKIEQIDTSGERNCSMDKIYNYYEYYCMWCFHNCAKNVQLHCPYPHPNRTWPLHDDYLNKFMWVCAFLLAWMFVYFCLIFFVSSCSFPMICLWVSWCRFGYDDAYSFWGFGTVMRTKVLITSTLRMYCIRTYEISISDSMLEAKKFLFFCGITSELENWIE